MEDATKRKCYKRLKTVLYVSLILNLVLIITLLGLYIARQLIGTQGIVSEIQKQTDSDDLNRICLPCGYIGSVFMDDVHGTLYEHYVDTTSGRLCCVDDRDLGLADVFVKMMMGHSQEDNKSQTKYPGSRDKLRWWRERDFSAHLYADENALKDNVVRWTSNKSFGTGFIRNLTLLPDRSKVRLTSLNGAGVYFIYSVFTLNVSMETHIPMGYHRIQKTNQELPDAVWNLALTKFGGIIKGTADVHTSFVCATETLQLNDTLDITFKLNKLSEGSHKHIHAGTFSNYFGMFRL